MVADQELRPLFAYNQPITTVYDTRPTVDLVWEGGRLVIEIDGADHRGEQKFAQDRKRDFELLMSGYRVARFTSSSVIEQTDAVVNQIRRAVRYLQSREKK
jgi:very-short-patch-repair endonuclease